MISSFGGARHIAECYERCTGNRERMKPEKQLLQSHQTHTFLALDFQAQTEEFASFQMKRQCFQSICPGRIKAYRLKFGKLRHAEKSIVQQQSQISWGEVLPPYSGAVPVRPLMSP